MKSLIQSLEVSYFVHSTEDRAKVDGAVSSLLGPGGEAEAEAVEGHFGNPIVVTKVRFVGEEAEKALRAMVAKMGPATKDRLRRELGERVDEHSALYLRLDKQKLVRGEAELTDSDPVRVRIKPRLHAIGGPAARVYLGLLG
ncbi:MAG: hypothetical protein JRN24_01570 [Nitrososphaerota archaeon]|nr:hypothetical protein [Nitrososphaerota archaeon]